MPRRPWVTASGRSCQNQAPSASISSRWRSDMHRSSECVAAIATALAKAQTELSNPEKAMVGTVYNNRSDIPQSFRYASLSSGLEIIRKTLGSQQIDRSGRWHGKPDHGSPAHLRGVDFLGLAGLPVIRDICTPPDGSRSDLRPPPCALYERGDRSR